MNLRIGFIILTAILMVTGAGESEAKTSKRMTPVVEVVREWSPSVVNISTEKIIPLVKHPVWKDDGVSYDDAYKKLVKPVLVGRIKLHSVGSGVVIRNDGLIATNAHVIHKANQIYVTYKDGRTVKAHVSAVSENHDLAIIRVEEKASLTAVKLADSDQAMIGETVIAIGNPIHLSNSVSVGIVSGTNRSFKYAKSGRVLTGLIQTDAPINAGNSGGALFNLDGELLGLNLAVIEGSSNIGFAIPAKIILKMIYEFKELTDAGRNTTGR